MLDYLLSLISPADIFGLPAVVMIPGLVIIALFLIRSVRSLLTFRIITAFTSLIYAFVIAVILSQGGSAIVQLLGIEKEALREQVSTTPAFPSDFRYSA